MNSEYIKTEKKFRCSICRLVIEKSSWIHLEKEQKIWCHYCYSSVGELSGLIKNYLLNLKEYIPYSPYELDAKYFNKISLKYSTFIKTIDEKYNDFISQHKLPPALFKFGSLTFDSWYNENVVSDIIASTFLKKGNKSSENIFLNELLKYLKIYKEYNQINIEREKINKISDKKNLCDINIELIDKNSDSITQIAIEHKIKHELSKSEKQLQNYNKLGKDIDIFILLSSKDADREVFDNYLVTLKESKNRNLNPDKCYKITHLTLLKILLPTLRNNNIINYGFVATWLAEICYNFMDQKCIREESGFYFADLDDKYAFKEYLLQLGGKTNEKNY